MTGNNHKECTMSEILNREKPSSIQKINGTYSKIRYRRHVFAPNITVCC
uniref:Uncharacterized protein n=1 Tax=Rhizophora mucronata TaxID=61149 RepID=A0A2P2JV99_RHIMU